MTAAPVVASAVPPGVRTHSGVSTPGAPSTGTVTPAMSELPADQVEHSLRVSLADLCAKAAVLYSQQKNYEEAAEVYARAAEMQAEINGEMSPQNAEILFLYGRALFKVGQSKSDVLGGKAPETGAGASGTASSNKASAKAVKNDKAPVNPIAEGLAAAAGDKKKASSSGGAAKEEAAALDAKKPLFQFTGDEEWDVSDEEEVEGDDDEEADEEDDDLAVAFEVLDLSRVLFEKQIEATNTDKAVAGAEEKLKEVETKEAAEADDNADQPTETDGDKLTPATRHILERLADTHDLLAEISLENERYPNAIEDSRASLSYKQRFLPEESEIVAEAHFKLSLALEFASVTTSTDDAADASASSAQKDQQVDQGLRDEAARELEAAINSTKLKLQNKEIELATLHSPEDNESTRRQITEVKEIIADMEQRLIDLKKPPIDLNEAVNGGPAGAAVGGLLSALGGASASGSSVEMAKKGAKDLSGLVRKKAKDTVHTTAAETASNGSAKRKAEEPVGEEEDAKKARTEETV